MNGNIYWRGNTLRCNGVAVATAQNFKDDGWGAVFFGRADAFGPTIHYYPTVAAAKRAIERKFKIALT